jgi:cytochrome c6
MKYRFALILGLWLAVCWLSMAPAWAATADAPIRPAPLFEYHCAGCHPNGGNIIRRGKTLKQRALIRNGYESAAAMATLIAQGKGNMSAFGDRLSAAEIQALTQYVLAQATANWQ